MLQRWAVVFLVIFQAAILAEPGIGEEDDELEPKSANTATMLSLLHTVGGISMSVVLGRSSEGRNADLVRVVPFMYGIIIGPSAGNLYAEDNRRAYRGMLIRAGGLLLVTSAAFTGLGGRSSDFFGGNVQAMFLIGAFTTVGSMVYSIFSGGESVREYNKRLMEPDWQFGVLPEGDALKFGLTVRF